MFTSRQTTTALTILVLFALLTGCAGQRAMSSMSASELLEEGMNRYAKKRWLSAIEHFQACVYNFPGEPLVDTAQHYLALAYFGNREYEVAQVEFNRLVLNYPASDFFEEAIFMRAVSFFRGTPKHHGLDQTELQQAIRSFEEFIIDFPEAAVIDSAHHYLDLARTRLARKTYESGVVYERMNAFNAAKVYFQKVIDEYTNSEFASKALFFMARIELRQHNYAEAHKQFKSFGAVYPRHEWLDKATNLAEKAAFKQGEASFRRGNSEEAKEELDAYIQAYPDGKYTAKAGKYLNEIATLPPKTGGDEDAGS